MKHQCHIPIYNKRGVTIKTTTTKKNHIQKHEHSIVKNNMLHGHRIWMVLLI